MDYLNGLKIFDFYEGYKCEPSRQELLCFLFSFVETTFMTNYIFLPSKPLIIEAVSTGLELISSTANKHLFLWFPGKIAS